MAFSKTSTHCRLIQLIRMAKTGSPLSCNSLANSCTCSSMSYKQNHYKQHLTWNIHGLANGPLLSWTYCITAVKTLYCNTIMCNRHVSCDTPQFNMRIPDSIIPKHEGVWGMQIEFHVLLPRLVQAWDSHECIHTSRAMNVASSRGMFALAVAWGWGGEHPRAEHWEPFFESIDLNIWKGSRICVSRTVHIRCRVVST
jgi:hypothetical protein